VTDYERVDDGLAQRIVLEEGAVLTLAASDLRPERTGVHGKLRILINNVEMAYSALNLDRDEDRSRLANQAFKEFGPHLQRNKNGTHTHYTDADFRKDVRRFTGGLWQARVELDDIQAVEFAGTAEPVPTQFVLRPYVIREGGTILFAHPGKGKSYITGLMMVNIDAADEIDEAHTVFNVSHSQKVLFINLERGPLSVSNRLGNINAALGLPRTRPILTINARGKSLADIKDAAKRAVALHGVEVIVLDSISRAGLGDLNENNPVNKIIDTLNGLAPTWIGIAHAPRSSDEHLYGSIHFEAGADVVVRLLSQQEEGGPLGIGLQITKENDVGKHALRLMALEFDGEFGLKAVRAAEAGEFPEVEQGRAGSGREGEPMALADRLRVYMRTRGVDGDDATRAAAALKANRGQVSALFQGSEYYLVRTGAKNVKVYALCPPGMARGPASPTDDEMPF
jgi:hypothetical protein